MYNNRTTVIITTLKLFFLRVCSSFVLLLNYITGNIENRKIIILITLTLFQSIILAQTNLTEYTEINSNDGLIQNTIRTIYQDKAGFIWIGTEDGLSRYDGRNFKNFTPDIDSDNALSNGIIYDICEDNQQNLYIATQDGVNVYDVKYQQMRMLTIPKAIGSCHNISSLIVSLSIDKKQRLWIATQNCLLIYNIKDKSFTTLNSLLHLQPKVNLKYISKLFTDSKGNIWFGTLQPGFYRYNCDRNTLDSFTIDNNKKHYNINNTIFNFFEDKHSNIWVTTNNGVAMLNTKSKEIKRYLFQKKPNESNSIYAVDICQIAENKLLIATMNKGLFTYNYNNDKCSSVNILSDESYFSLLNTQGVLWIGTQKGLIKINTFSKPFKWINKVKEGADINTTNLNIVAMTTDYKGQIWIGTTESVFIWKNNNGVLNNYLSEHSNKLTNINSRVFCLQEDANHNMWIGTYQGIKIYNPTKKTIQSISANSNKQATHLINNSVISLLKDKNGNMWIGTKGGISVYDTQKKEFINYSHNPNDSTTIPSNMVMCIHQDKNNDIWVATRKGLVKYNADKKNFIRYRIGNKKIGFQQEIISIDEDKDGLLWLATGNLGLVLFNPKDADYKIIPVKHKFGTNLIFSLKNAPNNVWFSSTTGIGKYSKLTGKITAYTQKDGIKSNELNSTAISINDSILAFGAVEGITYFNKNKIKADNFQPKIAFTKLEIEFNEIVAQQKYRNNIPIAENINNVSELILNHDDNVFNISFAAFDYKIPDKIVYAYKLKGMHKDWVYTGHDNTAKFAVMPHGEYELVVKATNSDEMWSKNTKKIKIIVKTPWWQTTWFRIIIIITLIILVVLIIRLRLKNLKRSEEILKRRVKERTIAIEHQQEEIRTQNELIEEQNIKLKNYTLHLENEIEQRISDLILARNKAEESNRLKTAFISNISHEIRTPLNAIIGFSELMDNKQISDANKIKYLRIIQKSGIDLLNLFDKLLSISLLESKKLTFNISSFNPNLIINELYQKYLQKLKIATKNVILAKHIDVEDEEFMINYDSSRLKQILNYLLNNAITYTNFGSIDFGYVKKDNILEFFVKDTGIGIIDENTDIIFTKFGKLDDPKGRVYRGTGLSLTISKELVELLGGKIWVNSVPEKGSCFYFTVPINHIEK